MTTDDSRPSYVTSEATDDEPTSYSTDSTDSTRSTDSTGSTGSTAVTEVRREAGPKLVTDRVIASVGLLALRLTVAAVLGVHGVQKFQHLDATKQFFASTAIFAPEAMATVTAIGEILVAVGLVLGVAVRLAGLGTVLIGVGALVYVKWTGAIFSDKVDGFAGDIELLLVGAGLALLALGGGALGVDRWFRGRHKRGAAALRS